jgi:hypothetical protein
MNDLRNILKRIRERGLKAGGAISSSVIDELRKYRQRLLILFGAVAGSLLLVLMFVCYYLMMHPEQITHVKIVASFIGVGTGGVVGILSRVWKEWSQTTLLLILIEGASEAEVTALIEKLIRGL